MTTALNSTGFAMVPISVFESDLLVSDHSLFTSYIYCYCNAQFQQRVISVNSVDYLLNAGEFIYELSSFKYNLPKTFKFEHLNTLLSHEYLDVRIENDICIYRITNFIERFNNSNPILFFKLPRNIFKDRYLVSTDNIFITWLYFWHLANHDDSSIVVKQKRFAYKKGMVAVGSEKMGKKLNIQPANLRSMISSFERIQLIRRIVRNGPFTFFEIINYPNLEFEFSSQTNSPHALKSAKKVVHKEESQSVHNSVTVSMQSSHTDIDLKNSEVDTYISYSSDKKEQENEINSGNPKTSSRIRRPPKPNIIH